MNSTGICLDLDQRSVRVAPLHRATSDPRWPRSSTSRSAPPNRAGTAASPRCGPRSRRMTATCSPGRGERHDRRTARRPPLPARWLESEAPERAPTGLIDQITTATRSARPRPTWIARLEGHHVDVIQGGRRSSVPRLGLALAVIGFILAVAGAIALVGSRQPDTVRPQASIAADAVRPQASAAASFVWPGLATQPGWLHRATSSAPGMPTSSTSTRTSCRPATGSAWTTGRPSRTA